MNEGPDTLRYKGEEKDTPEFLQAAIDAFSKEHCGLPDGIIVNLWRIIAGLPANQWTAVPCGAIPISLHASGDLILDNSLRFVTVAWDEAFCFRATSILADTPVAPADGISAEQGEPTLHGITASN